MMIEIIAFAFGIMYSPGPVNLVSLNAGLSGQMQSTLKFCTGVGCAMFVLLLLFGYIGAYLISPKYQLIVSIVGCAYIIYVAMGIANAGISGLSRVSRKVSRKSESPKYFLGFKAGFLMQFLNPKALVVILPIVTVQFPAAQISGSGILFWSIVLATMAFGAPSSYLLLGCRLGKRVKNPLFFCVFNVCMALLLLFVAIDIAYHYIFLVWDVSIIEFK